MRTSDDEPVTSPAERDVEYNEEPEQRICDCGTVLRNGSWCGTCRQHIWDIR